MLVLHQAGWSWVFRITAPEHELVRLYTVLGEELECGIFARTVRQLESISRDGQVMGVRVTVQGGQLGGEPGSARSKNMSQFLFSLLK